MNQKRICPGEDSSGGVGCRRRERHANLFDRRRRSAASQYPVFAAGCAGGGRWPAASARRSGSGPAGAKTLLVENPPSSAAWRLGPWECHQPGASGGSRAPAIHELLIRKLTAYGDQAVANGQA